MMQQSRATIRLPELHGRPQQSLGRKIAWTIGNLLIFCGLYVLLFVGGLLADEQYNIYASSGTTEIDLAPAVVEQAPPPAIAANEPAPAQAQAEPPVASNEGPSRFNVPVLNNGGSELTSAVVPSRFSENPSTVSRIVIPKLELDKKVVEVGYTTQQTEGQNVIVWEVDKYRVGHHAGTSNPGDGGNVVLAGHSGGAAYPFNDIYYLEAGDLLQLYSDGQLYNYTVTERLVVDEDGQPLEKRLENARYIEQTPNEVVTMVTCWPLSDTTVNGQFIPKFSQRVIVRAEPTKPAGNVAQSGATDGEVNNWVAR